MRMEGYIRMDKYEWVLMRMNEENLTLSANGNKTSNLIRMNERLYE